MWAVKWAVVAWLSGWILTRSVLVVLEVAEARRARRSSSALYFVTRFILLSFLWPIFLSGFTWSALLRRP